MDKATSEALDRAQYKFNNECEGANAPKILYVPRDDYPLLVAAIQENAAMNDHLPFVSVDEGIVSGHMLFGSILRPEGGG